MSETGKISPAVRDIVEQSLEQIEESLDTRVVLAIEAGPRGEGTPSLDSPHRVKFVYVHRLDWYLSLTPGIEHVELPVSDEFTMEGWDIRLLLRTMRDKDDVETEWLRSGEIYRADADVLARLCSLSARKWQPAREFSGALERAEACRNTWRLGTNTSFDGFMKAMRAILVARWIADGRGPLPGSTEALFEGLNEELQEELRTVIAAKEKVPGADTTVPAPRSQVYFLAELQRLKNMTLPAVVASEQIPYDRFCSEVIRRFG